MVFSGVRRGAILRQILIVAPEGVMRKKTNRKEAIKKAYQIDFAYNMAEMARVTGVSRMTLHRHIKAAPEKQSAYISEEIWEKVEKWAGQYEQPQCPPELETVVKVWPHLSDEDRIAVTTICRMVADKYKHTHDDYCTINRY
jgi:hypothetical protein